MPSPPFLELAADSVSVTAGGIRLTIPVGPNSIAREHLRSWPPRAAELEAAIASIEDALEAVRAQAPRHQSYVAAKVALQGIVRSIGAQDSATLGRDAIEAAFNRMAEAADGNVRAEGVPVDRIGAATLLVLREIVHHWDVASIGTAGV